MFRKLDALFSRVPFYARVSIVVGLGMAGARLVNEFSGPAQGVPHVYNRPPAPDITRAMVSIMQGIEKAQGDNSKKLPDIPGLDFI